MGFQEDMPKAPSFQPSGSLLAEHSDPPLHDLLLLWVLCAIRIEVSEGLAWHAMALVHYRIASTLEFVWLAISYSLASWL